MRNITPLHLSTLSTNSADYGAANKVLVASDRPEQALHCKNMQKARELWDSIMTKGNAKYANMWLEYYNLERSVNILKMVKVNRVFLLS